MMDREIIERLNSITGADPEGAHGEADELLRLAAPVEVRAAYDLVKSRCDWWACA
jgi:hypothetical protein